jgi:hypothetical protein
LKSPQLRDGVIFVLFDEGAGSDHANGGGHVPAFVLGPLVRSGSVGSRPVDHYNVLRTIEQRGSFRISESRALRYQSRDLAASAGG